MISGLEVGVAPLSPGSILTHLPAIPSLAPMDLRTHLKTLSSSDGSGGIRAIHCAAMRDRLEFTTLRCRGSSAATGG